MSKLVWVCFIPSDIKEHPFTVAAQRVKKLSDPHDYGYIFESDSYLPKAEYIKGEIQIPDYYITSYNAFAEVSDRHISKDEYIKDLYDQKDDTQIVTLTFTWDKSNLKLPTEE